MAEDFGSTLDIGGGEPTIHPNFWDFLGIALSYNVENVWLATNGKKTATAIRLADLAKKGAISCRLSLDKYHDPIDQKVIDAFKRDPGNRYENDNRASTRQDIYDGWGLINSGRAKKLDMNKRDCCSCDTLFIVPSGKIFACGCQKTQFGTVFAPKFPKEYEYNNDLCWERR